MDKNGLEMLNNIFEGKNDLVRKLKGQDKKVIGYLCYFAPPELISAAGMIPYRILGSMDSDIVEANRYTEPLGCPYIRNCFEQDLTGKLDFLDGLIIPHSCDSAQRIYGIWNYYKKPQYSYLFNVPHKVTPWSRAFYQRELTFFKESLEAYGGRKISDEELRSTIDIYNDNRMMVQSLYDLRKERPPALSGTEMFKMLVAGMTIPPENFNALLKEITGNMGSRPKEEDNIPRIMFWGCILDDTRLFELIEDAGARVVTDDTCIGTRSYLRQIDTSLGLMEGLTKAYFEDFKCPRTDRGPGLQRFDYVLDLARTYHVQGVIGYSLSFCDPHKLDYPDLRDYLDRHGIPMLLLDDDYSLSNMESVKSRVEAFIEML